MYLVRDNYLEIAKNLWKDKTLSRHKTVFVAFGLFAPRVVNISGANRSVTFKISIKQNKEIVAENHEVYVSVVGDDDDNFGRYHPKKRAVFTNSTQQWRADVIQSNGEQAINISMSLNRRVHPWRASTCSF